MLEYTDALPVCESCPAGKAKQAPVKKVSEQSVKLHKGDLMYSDTSGKLAVPSTKGARYTHTVVDSHSRMGFPCGLIRKSDITAVEDNLYGSISVGTNHDLVVKEVLTDGDRSNYNSVKYKSMLAKRKIQRLTIPEYVSAYAGVIERNQGSCDSMALAALHYANLGYMFYIMAYVLAWWVKNRMVNRALGWDIPWLRWQDRDVCFKFLRIFGCPATVTVPHSKRIKHQTRS